MKEVNSSRKHNNSKVYAYNNTASKYIEQKVLELQWDIDKSTVIAEKYPLSIVY